MRLNLDVGRPWLTWGISWRDKCLILAWTAETSLANVLWQHMMTVKFRWPPVRSAIYFALIEGKPV